MKWGTDYDKMEKIFRHNADWVSIPYRRSYSYPNGVNVSYQLYHIGEEHMVVNSAYKLKQIGALCMNAENRTKKKDQCHCIVPDEVLQKHLKLLKLIDVAKKIK